MRELKIDCLGLEVSNNHRDIMVTLQDLDMGFIEDLSPSNIVLHSDNNKLLEAMDSDIIMDYLQANYDVTIKDHSREMD